MAFVHIPHVIRRENLSGIVEFKHFEKKLPEGLNVFPLHCF